MSPRVMQALGGPMPASLIYALREALAGVEEEGLHARWGRHQKLHEAFVTALDRLNLALLPAPGERLWKLNAVAVPEGVDDGAVRSYLLQNFTIEIGAGLDPLARKGASSWADGDELVSRTGRSAVRSA